MPTDARRAPSSEADSPDWPGKGLGLPASGARSIGRIGRRVAAISLDWAISVGLSISFFAYDATATLLIFAVLQVAFIATTSGSIGHLVTGLRVVPMSGGWVGPLRPLARTLLLCLVIPAVIWDRDQRGLHDRLAGTVLVRR